MPLAWLVLVSSAVAILWSGRTLVRAAEGIALATGLSRGWVGFILVGMVTSLPELVVTMTGGGIEVPAIAVGNSLGSNAFNIGVLALGGLFAGKALFAELSTTHGVSASMGIMMSAVVLAAIALGGGPAIGSISVLSILIVVLYLGAAWLQYTVEKQVQEVRPRSPLGTAAWRAGGAAVVVVIAGVALTYAARAVTEGSGITQSLMGATLVALATSLPELASSWEALRIGAYDMLAGNIFGSNAFNVFTVFFTDLTYGRPVLGGLGGEQSALMLVGAWGIGLAAMALVALHMRARWRWRRVDIASALVLLGYLAGLAALATRSASI